jgi:hypothetical protein
MAVNWAGEGGTQVGSVRAGLVTGMLWAGGDGHERGGTVEAMRRFRFPVTRDGDVHWAESGVVAGSG